MDCLRSLSSDHFQRRVDGHRTQIDETSIDNQDPPGFSEGMNHALMRHSSERSGEEHDIEGSRTERQSRRAGLHDACSREVAGMLQATARIDQRIVLEINPDGALDHRRVMRGQAAIPTSDFENCGVAQIDETLDLTHFDLLGVNPKLHTITSTR